MPRGKSSEREDVGAFGVRHLVPGELAQRAWREVALLLHLALPPLQLAQLVAQPLRARLGGRRRQEGAVAGRGAAGRRVRARLAAALGRGGVGR